MTTTEMKAISPRAARAQYVADHREIVRRFHELHGEATAKAAIPHEPGKSAGNQQNEPENNPGNSREQTENNPSDPGMNPTDPGKSSSESARSPFEPAHGPRGFLNELPLETQHEILDLLGEMPYVQVIMTLAQPKPDGLGVRVSRGALERFYERHQLARLRQECAERAAEIKAFITDPSISNEDVTHATARVVRTRLLELSQQARAIDTLGEVAAILDKLRRTDISERQSKSKESNTASRNEPS